MNPADYIGRPPERLTITERWALAGQWIALELYNSRTLPLRNIAAIGASPSDCVRQLQERNLDPARFEYLPLTAPY